MTTIDLDSDSDRSDAADLDEEFDELLRLLDIAADSAEYKLTDGRVTDPKREQARSKWCNTLVKVVRERRQVIESRELVRLSEELEQLKEQREHGSESVEVGSRW